MNNQSIKTINSNDELFSDSNWNFMQKKVRLIEKKMYQKKIYDVCLKTVFHIFRMIDLKIKLQIKSVRHFLFVDPVTKIKIFYSAKNNVDSN